MGEILGKQITPHHSFKPVCIVKTIHLASCLALLFSISLLPTLAAQSWQQKEAATEIISQLHKNRHTFSIRSTRFLTAKDAQRLINENPGLSVESRRQLFGELQLDGSVKNWRGVFTELMLDCGSIPVMASASISPDGSEVTGVVTVHLPPDNACSKLTDRLATTIYGGLIAARPDVNLVRCDTYECILVPGIKDSYQCVQTVIIATDNQECPLEETCEDYPDCEASKSGGDYTSTVFEKLFGK